MRFTMEMPFENWPKVDREMWEAQICVGSLLDDPGGLSHLRIVSQRLLRVNYGRWLGWLNRQSPSVICLRPDLRATTERLQEWLDSELAHTTPMTHKMYIDDVMRVLEAAYPQMDWTGQRRLRKFLRLKAKTEYGARKNGRILSSSVLFEAGLESAFHQANQATTTLEANKRRRDGAMVAFLSLMPIRRRSFIELTLGRSIDVGLSSLTIRLSEDMTKNGLPWEARVPEQLEPVLRQYIDDVRPWFMRRRQQTHNTFWVTDCGKPFSGTFLQRKISVVTKRLTGTDVPPHFFRDAAATTLSRFSPEHARLIRPLLGHASYGTAERHYIQARTVEAGRDYSGVLKKLLAVI